MAQKDKKVQCKIVIIFSIRLTLCLFVLSADNFCKQFGPRSGPTGHQALSESRLFDTFMVFRNNFAKKLDFEEKISRRQKA